MRGIVRPCRHQLSPELHERWRAHLCGLCLTLRDRAGQAARVLTGYDLLLLSVLVEAQSGGLQTTTAAPCAFRGFRRAEVIASESPAAEFAAGAALLCGGAGIDDKVADGDIPRAGRRPAAAWGRRLTEVGRVVSHGQGFEDGPVTQVAERARLVEAADGRSLDDLLAPAGDAVAALFAHTATLAAKPANAAALARAGDAFGRLVHLLDAVGDRGGDRRAQRFNPLEATGTSDEEARLLAGSLHATITGSLDAVDMADRELADALFGPAIASAIRRALPPAHRRDRAPARRGRVGVGVVSVVIARAAIFGSRRPRYYDDPYAGGGYYGGPGYRRGCRGPSCGEMLACDCCANCACDECCGGDECCCCCL
ncbi:MAG TPA: DUF5685 family protein [Acidimicrobiales bacterium]|jgi:hypothetical protein|nr:DUF5685 family protein [Acidimicrobiales bacterium]